MQLSPAYHNSEVSAHDDEVDHPTEDAESSNRNAMESSQESQPSTGPVNSDRSADDFDTKHDSYPCPHDEVMRKFHHEDPEMSEHVFVREQPRTRPATPPADRPLGPSLEQPATSPQARSARRPPALLFIPQLPSPIPIEDTSRHSHEPPSVSSSSSTSPSPPLPYPQPPSHGSASTDSWSPQGSATHSQPSSPLDSLHDLLATRHTDEPLAPRARSHSPTAPRSHSSLGIGTRLGRWLTGRSSSSDDPSRRASSRHEDAYSSFSSPSRPFPTYEGGVDDVTHDWLTQYSGLPRSLPDPALAAPLSPSPYSPTDASFSQESAEMFLDLRPLTLQVARAPAALPEPFPEDEHRAASPILSAVSSAFEAARESARRLFNHSDNPSPPPPADGQQSDAPNQHYQEKKMEIETEA